MTSIPLILSNVHSCSYLEDELAQSVFVHPGIALNPSVYQQLLAQGFRRSGDDVYRPHCQNCNACIPVRIPVPEFKANRSQSRCLKKNVTTRVIIQPADFQQKHYELYIRYQHARHQDSHMAETSPADYLNFLGSSWCDTRFVEFFIENKLAAIAVIDIFEHVLSAVYTFFDPQFSSYSPGVYAVLWQIEYAKQLQKKFVYLGYWIKQCKKCLTKFSITPWN